MLIAPKRRIRSAKILGDASDNEKAMFSTILIQGVVTTDGREDLTQDLLMNGYLVSTNDDFQDDSINEREIIDNAINAL